MVCVADVLLGQGIQFLPAVVDRGELPFDFLEPCIDVGNRCSCRPIEVRVSNFLVQHGDFAFEGFDP